MHADGEEALTHAVADLKAMTLTVVEGDLGKSWLRENNLHFLSVRSDDSHPFGSAVRVGCVQIKTADTRCRHVGHCKVVVRQLVVDVNGRCVGIETGHHARRMPAEVPDILGDMSFC